jgi:aspartate aminotransferase
MQLSDRVLSMNESATLKMARMSNELKASGVDVINMSLGEPDFDTPNFIKDAAKVAIDENFTRYTPVPGIPDLRRAITAKLKRDNNLDYNVDQIVVSTGAKQTIANLILATINPGDEVLLPAPYWVSYKEIIQFAGGVVIEVPADITTDFKTTPEMLKKYISPRTKMFLFSNPCNPSGSVYGKNELQGLVDLFVTHPDILIVSDEIYELICFQQDYTSLGTFPKVKNQLVLVNGVSKGFCMTGWRIGYMAGPKDIAAACSKIQSQFTSGANSIAQKAAVAALMENPNIIKDMRDTFEKRRDLIFNLLSKIENLKVNKPQGAFYIFPDIGYFIEKKAGNVTIKDSAALCEYLLANFHIGVTPGQAFGSPNNIRLSYALDNESITNAVERLKCGLESLM